MSAELDAFRRLELLSIAWPRDPWALAPGEGFAPPLAKDGHYSARLKTALAAHPPEDEPAAKAAATKGQLTFEQRWQALEDHAAGIAAQPWPAMKATASLASRASELDLHRITARQLEQLLEDAQRRQRPTSAPIEPGGAFRIQPTPWAVAGLFRHGLNLLVGQPGAGKSRLAAACIAAWLRGDQTWLNLDLPCELPVEQRHALIVGTDQPLEDWSLTLAPVGLVQRLSPTEVQVHGRLTLHGLEAGTQLDVDGLALIRRWCDDHPGGVVLVDSLAACLPPGIDEDKPAAARPIHALQDALGSCWGLITHHSRKGAGRDGNIGVGAGRGSSAIDGAVSRVIGLGLIHKIENGVLQPQESDPRRELLSTKRGGKTLHLVIRSDGDGYWSNEGSAEDLKRQERAERQRANLTDAQTDALAVLEDASGWLTGRQVAEALLPAGEEYDGKGSHAANCRRVLKRLETIGLIESQRVGLDRAFRVAGQQDQPAAPNHSNASRVDEFDLGGSNSSNVAAQGVSVVRRPVRTCSEVFGDSEAQPEGDQLALLPGSPGFEQGANQFEQGANTLPNQSDPLRRSLRTIRTTPPSPAAVRTGSEQQGQTLFIGSGADAADDGGDDPAWPTRQDMQEGDHAAA